MSKQHRGSVSIYETEQIEVRGGPRPENNYAVFQLWFGTTGEAVILLDRGCTLKQANDACLALAVAMGATAIIKGGEEAWHPKR